MIKCSGFTHKKTNEIKLKETILIVILANQTPVMEQMKFRLRVDVGFLFQTKGFVLSLHRNFH